MALPLLTYFPLRFVRSARYKEAYAFCEAGISPHCLLLLAALARLCPVNLG